MAEGEGGEGEEGRKKVRIRGKEREEKHVKL